MTVTAYRKALLYTAIASLTLVARMTHAQGGPPVVPDGDIPPYVATPRPATPQTQREPGIPLRLLVTISRYEGGKRTSSEPFTLWVNANDGPSTLTTGQQVPIPAAHFSSSGGAVAPVRSFSYENVGTNITASATRVADGRFRVELDVQDSSVVPANGPDGMASLKSLRARNLLLLRSGQNAEFVAATDKVSGEVTRIEVTATVLD